MPQKNNIFTSQFCSQIPIIVLAAARGFARPSVTAGPPTPEQKPSWDFHLAQDSASDHIQETHSSEQSRHLVSQKTRMLRIRFSLQDFVFLSYLCVYGSL